MPKVSIIIRSRNDVVYIRKVLDAIYSQSFDDFEILNFDNGSTDGTKDIINEYENIQQFVVPSGTYVPGRVLNNAIEKCHGGIVVFNNSDSIPQNNFWLEELILPIISKKAHATYARQIARPDAFPWVKLDYKRAFSDVSFSEHFFSLVSAASTKTILKEYPFNQNIQYSEDVLWSKSIKENNYHIVYTPNAIVEHSHNYTIEQVKKRFYGEGFADGQIWNKKNSYFRFVGGTIKALLQDFFWLLKNKKIFQLYPSVQYRLAQKSAYFSGVKDWSERSAL